MSAQVGRIILIAAFLGSLSGGCAPARTQPAGPASPAAGAKPQVVATTSILGDVVKNVAGDAIQLTVLIAAGQDPHAYEPVPRDVASIENAQLVFMNGLGLEGNLEATVRGAASKGPRIVIVSDGVKPLGAGAGETPAANAGNPHVWFDPGNVKIWVRNIADALSALDPAQASAFAHNAAAYDGKLDELDAYIQAQVARLPAEQRKLVTDHEALEYYAARYGFKIVGTVIPGYSTSAEPSAAGLSDVIDKIRSDKVPAVFIGATANPKIADVVARETGAAVLPLYSESLGGPDSGANTYLNMMRTDTDTIVKGLGK